MVTSNPPDQAPFRGALSSRHSGLKVMLVDDHHLVREGMRLTLARIDAGVTVLEAASAQEAIGRYRQHPDTDLVLMDLGLPGLSGTESLSILYANCPDAKVVVLSATHDLHTVRAAIAMGVSGFIPKMAGPAATFNALLLVLEGGVYVPPEVFLGAGAAGPPQPKAGPDTPGIPAQALASMEEAGLTGRQIEVMRLLLEGRTNKQICVELDLALGTVKSHVAAILYALGATSRAQAVALISRHGWSDFIRGSGVRGSR